MSTTTFSNPIVKIADAARGTILVNTPEQVSPVLQVISARVTAIGGKFDTKNFWGELQPLSLGYVGVHRRCWVPIPEASSDEKKTQTPHAPTQKKRYIRFEVQVHFKTIMDETEDCTKHFAHRLYKRPKEAGEETVSPEIIGSSQLIYLTAMTRLLTKKEDLDKVDNTLQNFQAMTKADRKIRLVMATGLLLQNHNLGPSDWNEKLQVLVPKDPQAIARAWINTANKIHQLIALPPENNNGLEGYINTATTLPELCEDAKKIAPFVQNLCQEAAASQPGCIANFGPKDRCLLKTRESLLEKIEADYEIELRPFVQQLLQRINRSWAQVTGSSFLPFGNISLLQSVDFSNCATLTDNDLYFLQRLPGLQSLNLSGCLQLTDAGLVHLEGLIGLVSLNLSGCRITDEGLSHLWSLPRLQSVNVYRCQGITDAGLARTKLECLYRNYPMHPTAAPPQPSSGPQGQEPAKMKWITPVELVQKLNASSLVRDYGAAVMNWYTALLRLAEVSPEVLPQAIPPLPLDIDQTLSKKCPVYGNKLKRDGTPYRVGDTHVLSLISQEFRTLNHLEERIVKPYEAATYHAEETPLRSRFFWSAARRDYGNVPFSPTYWVLKIRGVLPSSRGKIWDQQRAILHDLSVSADARYDIPTLQESYATFVTDYIATGRETLYFIPTPDTTSDEHNVYTFVKEMTGTQHMIIGGSWQSGLRITRHLGPPDESVGVVATRRL